MCCLINPTSCHKPVAAVHKPVPQNKRQMNGLCGQPWLSGTGSKPWHKHREVSTSYSHNTCEEDTMCLIQWDKANREEHVKDYNGTAIFRWLFAPQTTSIDQFWVDNPCSLNFCTDHCPWQVSQKHGVALSEQDTSSTAIPQVSESPLSEAIMHTDRGTNSVPSSAWLDLVSHPLYSGNAPTAAMREGVLAKSPFSINALPLCLLTFLKHTQCSLTRDVFSVCKPRSVEKKIKYIIKITGAESTNSVSSLESASLTAGWKAFLLLFHLIIYLILLHKIGQF